MITFGRSFRRGGGGGGGGTGDIDGVTAGAGMTGGGTSGTVTVNVAANADGSIIVNANDIQVGALGYARAKTALGLADSSLSLNDQEIADVADPTSAQAVATRAFVEALLSGIHWKESVRVATTEAITLSGEQPIDGVSVLAGDRVNVKDQPDQTENGPYLASAGAWTRTADANTGAEFEGGIAVWVTEGTENANTGWVAVTSGTVTIGTTPIVFSQFAGLTQIVAGGGLVQTGSTIDVVANADGSIVVGANDIQVGVLASDAQHGTRGGGNVHANAVAGGAAGFITGANQEKLDNLPGACSTTIWSADSAVSSSAHANGVRYVPLRDAQSDSITFQFASARTGTLELVVHYAMSSSSAADVRLRVDSLALSAADNPSDALTTGTAFTLTTSADVLLHQVTSSASGDLNFSVTLADIVIVTITRLGSDGADTHTGDFRVYQVRAT